MAEFPTLADIFEPIEGKSGTEANAQMRRWYTGTRQLPGAAPSEALTIVDDVIAPTSADVIVDTEGQAPADDLQIIKTDSTHDGMILSLRAANPDRVITVRATGQLNGITLWNRAELYVLSTIERLILQRDGNMWREARGIGLALATDSELTLENTDMAARASQLASLYFRTATLEGGIASLRPTSADAGKIPMVDSVGGFELSGAISTINNRIDSTDNSVAVSQQVMHVQDQKAQGTAGGTATAGAFRIRDLNTVVKNTISGASLANNQITLTTGKYEIDVVCPGYYINRTRARVYNITDSKAEITGTNDFTHTSVAGSVKIHGFMEFNEAKTIEIQQLSQGSQSTNGLGLPMGDVLTGFGVEVYTNVTIRRIA